MQPVPPTAIVTDIEGTTTPIAFVRDALFPYARARLAGFLRDHADRPEIAAALRETAALAPGKPALEALLGWMDEDAKITPLKTLQGLIWDEGYRRGALKGRLYPDVAPMLRRWHTAGLRLYVYSSGSEAGDLTPLFSGFFDTRIGPKRAPASYRAIARAIGVAPAEIMFLSDIAAELDAASESGLGRCQLVRPQDLTEACPAHPTAADFDAVNRLLA
jgi:enolase-phosphatase E1